MSKTLLIAEGDESNRIAFRDALTADGYHVIAVRDGATALDAIKREGVSLLLTEYKLPDITGAELLEQAKELQPDLLTIVMTGESKPDAVLNALRNKAVDFLSKPFMIEELLEAVGDAMGRSNGGEVEIISAKPDWLEIHVPCDLSAVEPINRFICKLQPNLPQETREAISQVFREMLNNAIEHGGKCDPSKKVEVKCVHLKRMILCSIKDPGEGFDLNALEHAAVSNPDEEPFRHLHIRQEKGIRPGGFGILFASQLVDELIYNEKHNELIFVKYLDEES